MTRLAQPIGPHDHALGTPDAAVTLVEYGDYQCPYCREANGIVRRILEDMSGQVRFVYRHFPLTQLHRHALAAAEAAEAAAAQGQFWPMHDMLFDNQDALDFEDLVSGAKELGLDAARFADDVRDGAYLPRIKIDMESGVESGVAGTPTFFIDGRRHEGAWDRAALEDALTRAARDLRPRHQASRA